MFAIILVFVVGFLYYVYQRYRRRNLPPYAEGYLPIVGHSLFILSAKNYHTLLTEIFNHYLQERKHEIMTLRLGIWDIHVTMSPEHAYLIANSSLRKDPKFYDFFKPFLGDGLITAPVATWKPHRKLLNPTFNQQVLDEYLHEINSQSRDLIDTISVQVGKGPFNHTTYTVQTILQIICATSMGSTIDAEDKHTRKKFVEALQEFFIALTERLTKFWYHSDLIYKLSGRQNHMDKITDRLKVLSQTILKKKKAEYQLNKNQINDSTPTKRFKPFIELLLELSEDGSLTDQEISDELNTFVGAGTDTMAITLSNALTCIGSDSAIQYRILKELYEVFQGSDRDVEKHDLSKLKYLEAVIRETLRMYPPIPFVGRVLDKELKIEGYTFPVGSKCYIAVYGLLRHWSWGPDADQFRPERWLDGSLPHNMKGFAAFGVGKRNCIGYTFAIMGLKTILANFLRRYSIKSDVTKMVQEFYIMTKPLSGHEIAIELR